MPTPAPRTSRPRPALSPTSQELARHLFGPDFEELHEPWRAMLGDPAFHYEPDLTSVERIAQSYQRLRAINSAVSPMELATDPVRLAAMHEWLAIADTAATSIASIHFNLFLGSLAEHHDTGRDLDDLFNLRATGVFLATEVGHGCDAASLETTAHRNPDTGWFTLTTPGASAQKFMPNTSSIGGPKVGVVAARLMADGIDHGPFLFVVPLTTADGPLPGVRIRPLPQRTGQPLDHSITSFDHVQLPPQALLQAEHGQLDGDGTFTSKVASHRKRFLRSLARVTPGKLCMTAASCGISRAALTIAVRYAHHRHISAGEGNTVPIAAHTSHHERLVGRIAVAYAMTMLHRRTLQTWAEHDDSNVAAAEREVAITKAWITWRARDIATETRERCGAHGMFELNGLAHASDLDGAITAEGDNLAISVKAAAELLREAPKPPPTVTVPSLKHAELRELHELLLAAESLAIRRAHDRLAATTDHGLSRWNASCLPALDAVSAHAASTAADAFLHAIENCDDPQARSILTDLCALFLLREVEKRALVLVTSGHLGLEAADQLPDAIEAIIAGLAPNMLTCVDSFQVPEAYLASIPIANPRIEQAYDDPQAHWNAAEQHGRAA
ncbi:acyl-CoA dehydrogenase [Streptomyces sp. NPDC047049]|uniref:acyl-CoA dehydrogenase family protein n=1 Tax=Streptomyces sp. NPDC047049 TaxID=3156688 RepID=UPI0033EE0F62